MNQAQLAMARLYCETVASAWTQILCATWQLPFLLAQHAQKPKAGSGRHD